MSNAVKITRRTQDVTIFQGDDAKRVEEARLEYNRELEQTTELKEKRAQREGDPSPLHEASQRLDEARDAGLPNAVVVTVKALGRRTFRGLKAQCPPREDNDFDEAYGFDHEKMADLLLEHLDAETGERTIIAPEFASKADLVEWLDDLNDGTFSELFAAALGVNQGGNPDPKASATSRLERLSGGTSTSPARMG